MLTKEGEDRELIGAGHLQGGFSLTITTLGLYSILKRVVVTLVCDIPNRVVKLSLLLPYP